MTKDDESFDQLYEKLNDMVNSSFNLGEQISETKIVRNVSRSLNKRFRPKIMGIEESKDISRVKIEELVRSLQTYELVTSHLKKNKNIALNTIKEENCDTTNDDTLRDDV